LLPTGYFAQAPCFFIHLADNGCCAGCV
jgi:hypothetical protein